MSNVQVRAVAPDRPEVVLQEHPGRRLRAARGGAVQERRRAADRRRGRRGRHRGGWRAGGSLLGFLINGDLF